MKIGMKIWIVDEPNYEYEVTQLHNEGKYFIALANTYSAPIFKLSVNEENSKWFNNKKDMLLANIDRAKAKLELEIKTYEEYSSNEEYSPNEEYVYFIEVSGLWQETTEQAYNVMNLHKFKVLLPKHKNYRILAKLEQIRGYALDIEDIEDLLNIKILGEEK